MENIIKFPIPCCHNAFKSYQGKNMEFDSTCVCVCVCVCVCMCV
jgi:hypothetical protein